MTAQGGDLLAWLTAAITVREEAARRLGGKPFEVKKYRTGLLTLEGVELHEDEIAHIVLHDPESVLRRCAADRKLLELHRPDGGLCTVCAAEETPSEDSEGEYEWSRDALPAPCATLLTLAEGYGWTEGER